jgi:Tol biopolymer transport system component
VSVSSNGAQGNQPSARFDGPAISASGRFIAFESGATNLVIGDTNHTPDIFVRDRGSGITERVSVDSAGVAANAVSGQPAISASGRYVAFQSIASNLVPGDTNEERDIFVHDRETGATERVSVSSTGEEALNDGEAPSISANGRYVAWDSRARNLVPGDTNSTEDVFVHDRQTGVTERVSVDSEGNQTEFAGYNFGPVISANGRHVAWFSRATNLVPDDTNGRDDVFVHDRETGITERVSVNSAGGQSIGGGSAPSISSNGRYVAFFSDSPNLVADDTNHAGDVFVHDRVTGMTERVSVNSAGEEGHSFLGSDRANISANGRYVAFRSGFFDLVPDDTNDLSDIFVHDRATGTTERISVDTEGNESHGGLGSWESAISAKGRYVAFNSEATDLVPGDTNDEWDVFVHTRAVGSATPRPERSHLIRFEGARHGG